MSGLGKKKGLHLRPEPHRHVFFRPICRIRIRGVISCCFLKTEKVSLFTGSTKATTKTLARTGPQSPAKKRLVKG